MSLVLVLNADCGPLQRTSLRHVIRMLFREVAAGPATPHGTMITIRLCCAAEIGRIHRCDIHHSSPALTGSRVIDGHE
jgi:hypothetical protein